jgi:predicted alpha/beta superfamily hydrolase
MYKACLVAAALLAGTQLSAQLPTVSSGRLVRLDSFPSKYVSKRHIDVWLPATYNGRTPHDVLYMHDGQMLYDSTTTWNKTDWQVDETIGRLLQENAIRPVIVVGVWNSGSGRHADYFPQKALDYLPAAIVDSLYAANRQSGQSVFNNQKVHSDLYLRFLVEELKPMIDKQYKTNTGRPHTFVAGSSMGGLISLYAICQYPQVFGGAACLSTHWPGIFQEKDNPVPAAFFAYMKDHLPDPATHRLYFDHGDQTLDAWYPPLQKQADEVLRQRGFVPPALLSRFFPGTDHSERAWASRLAIPLQFLLGK